MLAQRCDQPTNQPPNQPTNQPTNGPTEQLLEYSAYPDFFNQYGWTGSLLSSYIMVNANKLEISNIRQEPKII